MSALQTTNVNCEACPLKGRPHLFGSGQRKNPLIMFVADFPNEGDMENGKALTSKPGSFLRKVMHDIHIPEAECYYTYLVGCQPIDKKLSKEAIAACRSRLRSEIIQVKPQLIVALGGPATKALAHHKNSIMRAHGIVREVIFKNRNGTHRVNVVPIYHPSYVLRSGAGPKKDEPFRDFLEELEYAQSIVQGKPATIEPPYENYKHVTTQEQFDQFIVDFHKASFAACDVETTTMDYFNAKILCIGFSWRKGEAWTLDWALLNQNIHNTAILNHVLKDKPLAFHNGLYDVPFLIHHGLTNVNYYLDTMQAHYLLDERQGTHSLERLAVKYYRAPDYKSAFRELLGLRGFASDTLFAEAVAKVSQKDLFDYNGADTDYTYRLAMDLPKQVKAEGQLAVLKDIEMPSCRMFTEFYMSGLLLDREYLERLGKEWGDEETSLGLQMQTYALTESKKQKYVNEYGTKYKDLWEAKGFNPGSTQQLAHMMYDVLGLEPFGGKSQSSAHRIDADTISKFINTVDDPEARDYWTSKRTAMSQGAEGTLKGISGRTTQAYMLYWLRQKHEFPNLLLKWRHVRKRRSMYYTALKNHLHMDGRIRPQYDMTSTRTGRKSTRNPAIHNLPRGDEIYNIIIPDPGWCLIHADYAQAEMRMMAHYSGDEKLMHVLDTQDIHTIMVMEMFKLTQADIDKMPKDELSDKRISAKMITFGLPYGRSAAGLAPQLGVTKEEAQGYITSYFKKFPVLKQWIDAQRARGVKDQLIVSAFGRRRRFPLIVDHFHMKEIERQAGNMAIQSAINDLTLLAYTNSIKDIRAKGIPCKPGAHIHDSINCMVPIPFWVEAVRTVNESMKYVPFKTVVKFPAEVEVGDRWGNMITVVTKKGQWATLNADDKSIMPWLLQDIPKEG